MGKVVCDFGGELFARQIDDGRVTKVFGEQHNIDQFALLEQVVRVGVPNDGAREEISSGSWHTGTIAAPESTRPRCGRLREKTSQRGERS